MGFRVKVAIAAVIACAGGIAAADPRVAVRPVGDEAVAPELVDTLRIYLATSATVHIGEPLTGATLDARIAEATAGLAPAELVTWLEHAPDAGGAYTVVVVGERDGRAAVEVGRLDGSDATAVSRLLALRVGAFLDETLAAGSSSPLAIPRPERSLRPIAEVGGGGAVGGGGWHAEAVVAVGARHARPSHQVEAVAVGRFGWPRRSGDGGDQVALDLIDVGAGARLLVPVRWMWIGAAAELGARRIHADGMAADGGRGDAVRWLPVVRFGLDARIALGPVAVRATVGVERGLEVERFTVRGEMLAEVGTLVAAAGVALVVPLDRK